MTEIAAITALITGSLVLLAIGYALSNFLDEYSHLKEIARQIEEDEWEKRRAYLDTVVARHENIRYFGETGETLEYRHPRRSSMEN